MTPIRTLVAAALVLAPAFTATAQTITKCQDAEGNWHYGNYASEACGDRPITEMGASGLTVDVRESPPTVEELQAKKAAEQAAKEAQMKVEEKRRIDQTLLQKYPSEDVIITLREQRVTELEKQLEFNRGQLQKLRAEREAMPAADTEYEKQELHDMNQRIDRFERAIVRGQAAMEKTRSDYAKLLERYRQIERPQS